MQYDPTGAEQTHTLTVVLHGAPQIFVDATEDRQLGTVFEGKTCHLQFF